CRRIDSTASGVEDLFPIELSLPPCWLSRVKAQISRNDVDSANWPTRRNTRRRSARRAIGQTLLVRRTRPLHIQTATNHSIRRSCALLDRTRHRGDLEI